MATARWREFEKEMASLLEGAGFQVTPNAKAAQPRQTDIYAHDDKLRLLIEVKDRKKAIDVSDIDALRSRLNRTRSDNIGVVFSTSGLSSGAKGSIEADRTREILTFVGQEIEQLRQGRQNIRALIEQKRDALAVNGKVWQSTGPRTRYRNIAPPPSETEFWIADKPRSYFETRSQLSGASYILGMPDTGWGLTSGDGARLAIQLTLNDADELRDLLGYLHKMFGLSKKGMFSIHQTQSAWHGVGAENFIDAIEKWRDRYQGSSAKIFHHSEKLSYFDVFYTGWIQISAQQRVIRDDAQRASFLHHAEIIIQLPGIPVDTSRFVRLCQYVNNEWAHFEYISERGIAACRLKTPIRLDVLGTVVVAEAGGERGQKERTVVGLVARNPFYKRTSLPKELSQAGAPPLRSLTDAESIICDLRDWHEASGRADYYELEGIEVLEAGRGPLIRPFGTWNKLLNNGRPNGKKRKHR